MLSQHVRRIDQLDAVSLDSELFSLLNTQFRKSFSYLPNSFIVKYGPELDVIFRLLFKYLPLEYLGATFGQNVFEMKYHNSKTLLPASSNELRLFAVLTVCVPWLWNRVIRGLFIKYYKHKSAFRIVEASYGVELKFLMLWKILSLMNFCVFLQRAKYSSVIERFLQLRPLYSTTQDIKVLQYDGISKELLWHGVDEFLGFTLPLINIYRLKNNLKRIWLSLCNSDKFPQKERQYYECSICGNLPNFPHTIGCDHLFCYYCIASMVLVDPTFVCIDCKFAADGINSVKPLPINKPKSSV